jgi:hypothetical protein
MMTLINQKRLQVPELFYRLIGDYYTIDHKIFQTLESERPYQNHDAKFFDVA